MKQNCKLTKLILLSVLIRKVISAPHPLAPLSSTQDFQCEYEYKSYKEDHSNLLKCASNTVCVPQSLVCNGNVDCEDGSDETNCDADMDVREMQTNRVLCRRDEYRCQDEIGNCILLDQTCDGLVHCRKRDDEDPKACQDCKAKNCGYKCRITDFGGQCYCPDGSTLNDDDRTCSPVDFCQTDGGRRCQHYCNGDGTGYRCSCAENYFLAEDGHGCHMNLKNDIQFIISLDKEQIITVRLVERFGNLDTYSDYTYVFRNVDYSQPWYLRTLAYNNHEDTLFVAPRGWSEHTDLTAFINGKETVLRRDFIGPVHIAVDYLGKNIFYTQSYHSEPGIYVCTKDALFCRRIVAGKEVVNYKDYKQFHEKVMMNGIIKMDNETQIRMFRMGAKRQSYSGIALNPLTGKMVWIDIYETKRLMMANMDGTEIEELYDNGKNILYGITIDLIKDDAYFANWMGFKIMRINLKTKERHIVVSKGVGVPHALSFFDGHLYWTSFGFDWKATLRTARTRSANCTGQILRYFNGSATGLAIEHPHYQPMPIVNPCAEMAILCPWICVIVPGSNPGTIQGKCLCPYNYREEKGTCIYDETLTKKKHIHLMEAHSYVDLEYWKELCSEGEACLNSGHCAPINGNDTFGVTFCNCPSPFIGERCELADPRLQAGWIVFWILLCILVLAAVVFGILYQMEERVRELVGAITARQTMGNDLLRVRFIPSETSSQSETLVFQETANFSDT